MRIQHNITAMNAYRNYNTNTKALAKNLEKLSSGYRINRAGDDAAGLAISEKMRAQITGLEVAQKNAKDGISLVQTAEGAMTEVHDMLNRMYELAEQSSNGTYQDEVDREQMQKEIKSLSDEINRIADSTNFNGINLLDGSLGLNTKAFDISQADALKAGGGIDGNFVTTGTGHDYHLTTSEVAEVSPSFEIDFGDLKLTGDTTTTATVTFGNVTATTTASSLSGTKEAKDIANVVANVLKQVASGTGKADSVTPANNDSFLVDLDGTNKAVFKVDYTANDTKIKFTYEGVFDGTNVSKKTGFDSTLADKINAAIGKDVEITTGGTAPTQEGDWIHRTTNVVTAEAKVNPSYAGIDFKLDSKIVKDGNILEIDGKKYKFKVGEDSTTEQGDADVLIDVSAAKNDVNKQIEMAAEKMSLTANNTTTNFVISTKGNNTIHIDQTPASAKGDPTASPAVPGKKYASLDDLKAVFKCDGAVTPATGAGMKVEITPSEVKAGDTLSINGKQYVFTEDAAAKDNADKGIYYVQMGAKGVNAVNNLESKIKAVDGANVTARANGNTVEVYAQKVDGARPSLSGKGLTLQIGDTSDDFNKLTVQVNDMHTAAMGIGKIDIGTQDGASEAMKAIKDAINYVSDTRGDLGSLQNRLDHTISNLSVMQENIQDAEATIRDVDVAEEMMAYTKNNILVQSAQAMLAQANQLPQGVLQLLQ